MAEDIKVYFVIRNGCENGYECTEDMQLAYTTCEGHRGGGIQPKWIKESEVTNLDSLTKRDVYVLNEFAGDIFDKLRKTKCLLVGPRCLSCCLTEGTAIPSGPEPVFTVAMRGLIVTASGLSKQQKESIKRKVQWMGGIYNSALTDDTSHLVSDTVLSDKYIKSVEKGIPVMKETWVDSVWEKSLKLNVNGAAPEFTEHKLPPFYSLQVTTSGISKRDKQLIMKLVNEGGGIFSGAFQSETTDVVILTKDGVGSEKYKAALEYGKACVIPNWVKDSSSMGIALPFAKYRVVGASTSSPLAEHRLPDMSLNFSRITNIRPVHNFVDETRSTDLSTISGKMKMSQDIKKPIDTLHKEVQEAFENFDMSLIKKAGPIFDGYCIWLTGPDGPWRERASTIISRTGGVRYDAWSSRVTHVVTGGGRGVGGAGGAPVLAAGWLLTSVREERVADEAEFLIDEKPKSPPLSARKANIEPASPMSKRNLQLLKHGPLNLPPPKVDPLPEEPVDDIVNHYLSQNVEPSKEKTPEPVQDKTDPSTTNEPDITEDADDPTEEVEQIFRGIKIEVHGLEEEAICEIGAEISAYGGCLVASGTGGTHALVPLDFDRDELEIGMEAVTVFWVKDCLSQQELVPIEYYHRPVCLPNWGPKGPPLQGVVASLSTYSGVERAFLDELAKLLGATTQLRFCRRTTANSLASTHLICPTPGGDKFLGCVKWGLPAVTGGWLRDCAKSGQRLSERPYLVPGTTAPEPEEQNEETNKEDAKSIAQEETKEKVEKEKPMLPPPEAVRRNSILTRDEGKIGSGSDSDLSPASRYIAMARQGLLADSQQTPTRVNELVKSDKQGDIRTPPLEDALSTPNLMGLSPTTRRRLQAVKRGEMPSDPIKTPVDPFQNQIPTPDSAFGAALRPGSGRLSPDSRRRLWGFVEGLPTKEGTRKDRQTPLSEIKNRFLAQFNGDVTTPPSDHVAAPRKLHLQEQTDTPPSKIARFSLNQSPGTASITEINKPATNENLNTPSRLNNDQRSSETSKISNSVRNESQLRNVSEASNAIPSSVDVQLRRLSAALSGRNSSPLGRQRRVREPVKIASQAPDSEIGPESQPNTVGWDDSSPPVKRFMLSSNVDNREELTKLISELGAVVCESDDPQPPTHLLCSSVGRSEKMLGAVARGSWVLHPAYVTRSRAQGHFLGEEEFEWGNELATCLPPLNPNESVLAKAAYRWRINRHNKLPGPYVGVVALLHVPPARKKLLMKLIEAGDGQAPDLQPPYENNDITVCFADLKRYPLSERDAKWLKSKRIPVCAPVMLSAYLTDENKPNPLEQCLQEFRFS